MELVAAEKLARELMAQFGLFEQTPAWRFEFDDAKRRFGCCHRSAHFVLHCRCPSIQFIGAVERNRRDSVSYVILRFLVWHGEADYIQWQPR